MNWVVREYGNAQSIPTAVLLSYLRQELQVLPWLYCGLMSTVSAGSPCTCLCSLASAPAPCSREGASPLPVELNLSS